MRFVVIGGDAAGMSAASRAKRRMKELEVIVLEKTRDVSYSACGMPYNFADADRSMDDLIVRQAQVFREKQGIDVKLGHEVTAVNRAEKKVSGRASDGSAFETAYDKLLIATGGRAVILDIPGADLPGVMGLKSLEDGRRMKDFVSSASVNECLVLGMGYIGLEMAEALRNRNIQVTMVDILPGLLPWMPEEMAEVVKTELTDNDVRLIFSASAEKIEKSGDRLSMFLNNGSAIDSDMVLMGLGVKPNSEIAAAAGLEPGPKGSIAVNRKLQTTDPDIYAAGDCADAFHLITGERVWIPLALRANRAGWAVADNVTGEETELPGIVGSAVFKVFDLETARTGLSLEEARSAGFDAVENVIKSRSKAHSHPGNTTIHVGLVGDRKSGKLLGATMVGKEGAAHRINSAAVALHAGMTVEEFAQADMAYAPPFSPVWDPLLTAANQLIKVMT
jgi:NADPH-dependent 2,4-dienoyl-CoA reductase/sulfur reductase-like enzyme